VYREKSKYTAHFICPVTKNWLDFESPDVNKYDVKSCGDDCYDVLLYSKPVDVISFNSIGGLNIVNEEITFDVINAPASYNMTDALAFGTCPSTKDNFTFYIIVYVIFMIIAYFTYRLNFYPGSIFSGFVLAYMSYSIMACNFWIGAFLIIMSFLFMIFAAAKAFLK
jgi:hypothetical protein